MSAIYKKALLCTLLCISPSTHACFGTSVFSKIIGAAFSCCKPKPTFTEDDASPLPAPRAFQIPAQQYARTITFAPHLQKALSPDGTLRTAIVGLCEKYGITFKGIDSDAKGIRVHLVSPRGDFESELAYAISINAHEALLAQGKITGREMIATQRSQRPGARRGAQELPIPTAIIADSEWQPQ